MFKTFLSETTKNNFTRWLILLSAWIVIVLLQLISVNSKVIGGVNAVVQPILSVEVSLVSNINSSLKNLRSWYATARRVQDLEIRLSNALAQLSQLDQLKTENEKLRELLNSSDRSLEPVIITSPILSLAQPAVALPNSLKASDLVRLGSPVLVENTLVGLISRLGQDIAYVDLLRQREARPILAETNTGIQGIIKGDGRRVLFTEVPIKAELEVGQRVVTSGQEGINKGLHIGEIQSIQSGASAAVKTAVVQQYVSFYEADIVEVR